MYQNGDYFATFKTALIETNILGDNKISMFTYNIFCVTFQFIIN